MISATAEIAAFVEKRLLERNPVCADFFAREAGPLARACRTMAERFAEGGRLLAFGRGPYSTDAQHVSVEFVHPVIVGKRALPALDVSMFFGPSLGTMVEPRDIVMGFGPPGGDPQVDCALAAARARGAMTFALPGPEGDYAAGPIATDPFIHQEVVEVLYHTLWESVHVFFEQRELASEAGDAGFLYPFLGGQGQPGDVESQVAGSIRMKAAEDGELRLRTAREESGRIGAAVAAIAESLRRGGKLILFGNGGSATDANDFALDCVCPPPGMTPVPAVSLSAEPAILSALANDVGTDVIFLRQLIAQARPGDVAIGISTSGGSRNIIACLEHARARHLATVALLGYDGGEILRHGLADVPLVVRSDYIPRIQEVQASVYHVIREALEPCLHA